MKLIFIIKIPILFGVCTIPVTHLEILKQLGLRLISWNGFPNYVSKQLLHRLKSNSVIPSSNNSIEKNDIPQIIFYLPYDGKLGEQLLKRCSKKFKHCQNSNVKLRML